MMEKWYDSQWQTGLQPRVGEICIFNIAQMGIAMAKVQAMDKTEIVTIMSMYKTVGVDMIALA